MIVPYLVVFAISALLVAIAASRTNRSVVVRCVSGGLAVALVSVFAGIRDYVVGGPDVLIYGNRVFSSMLATREFAGMFTYTADRGLQGELGYYFINWVVSRVTADPHVLYAVLAAINATCILLAVMLMRNYGPAVVMWLAYMLTAYVEGFNLLRQSPALALAVLGIALVLRSRYKLGLLVGAAGLLFHNSAIVFFVMWGIAVFLMTRQERVGRAIWLVLILSVVALIAVAPILDLLSSSLADSKYQEYLGEGARGGRAFGVDALYRAVPIALGVWALVVTNSNRRPSGRASTQPISTPLDGWSGRPAIGLLEKRNVELSTTDGESTASASMIRRAVLVVIVLLSLELILLPVREISYPFYRLLAYFGYLRILAYGMIIGLLHSHRVLASIAAVAFSAAYFALIVIDRNEAFYASEILDTWLGN